MTQFAAGLASTIGGGLLNGIGGFLSGQSQKSQASKALEHYWNRTDEAAGRLGRFAFGDDFFNAMWNGTAGNAQPGGYIGSLFGQADQSRQLGTDLIREYNTRFGNLAQASRGNVADVQSEYQRELANILSRGQAAEGMASLWGRDREAVVRDENAAAQKAAQARARAQLNASGFGASSERAVTDAGIGVQYNRNLNDQLAGINDTRLGQQMAMRGQTNQLAAAMGGQRTGSLSNMLETDIARRYAVSAAFPQLAMALQNRDFQLQQQAGAMGLQVLGGATFNPWLNQNTTQYFQGGGIGGALQGIGNSATAAGSYLLGALNPDEGEEG